MAVGAGLVEGEGRSFWPGECAAQWAGPQRASTLFGVIQTGRGAGRPWVGGVCVYIYII